MITRRKLFGALGALAAAFGLGRGSPRELTGVNRTRLMEGTWVPEEQVNPPVVESKKVPGVTYHYKGIPMQYREDLEI